MPDQAEGKRVLDRAQINRFIEDGFVRVDKAFPRDVADSARSILWQATGCKQDDPSTWTKPVVRLGYHSDEPFVAAANTAVLHRAFDQLVGQGRWQRQRSLGTFPVRFPSPDDPGDAGWHVDASFDFDNPDFLSWRVNVRSRGRALLMLFLFSDVGELDAPTRIRAGSHLDIARILAPAGENGMTLRELAAIGFDETAHRKEVLATGEAGTVYLCHPFLVHAAQPHRGTRPRFLAQPPLLPAEPLRFERDVKDLSPIELAIRLALDGGS